VAVNCNPLTSLLRFVVDLLYSLFSTSFDKILTEIVYVSYGASVVAEPLILKCDTVHQVHQTRCNLSCKSTPPVFSVLCRIAP